MDEQDIVGRDINGRGTVSGVSSMVKTEVEGRLRPCAVDTNNATGLKPVGVGVLDVGDVPPDLVDRGEGGCRGEEGGEGRPLHVVSGEEEVDYSTLGEERCWPWGRAGSR